VDHPDGLADPAGYLRRLREAGRSYRELSAGELEEAWAATR